MVARSFLMLPAINSGRRRKQRRTSFQTFRSRLDHVLDLQDLGKARREPSFARAETHLRPTRSLTMAIGSFVGTRSGGIYRTRYVETAGGRHTTERSADQVRVFAMAMIGITIVGVVT